MVKDWPMMVAVGEETRPRAYVVRTMNEAYNLLEVDSPQFGPV